jgi:endonuclease/exonuclease/phosphatase family metal-dependent hydrolase
MRHAVYLLGTLVMFAGCGPMEFDGEEGGRATAGGKADDPGQKVLSLVTYNAGLARGAVALAEERLPQIIDALTAQSADVVCLQEVWEDEDAQKIQQVMRPTHPFAFREETYDGSDKDVKCNLWKTFMLDRCVKKNCTPYGISADECVKTSCADRYQSLTDECKLCLAANTASPIWCAVWPGARDYAWEGRNGLLLLSRLPIENPTYVPFDTQLVKRGMITATVAGVQVNCTHLSADLDSVPYPSGLQLTSWKDEQTTQVNVIDGASAQGTCTVLLGDLNTGPQSAGLTGELPEIYGLIEKTGFVEDWPGRQCTWCQDNPLTGSATDRQLDHIMLRGCQLTASYGRLYDGPIQVTADKNTLETRLSDHYGLRAVLTVQ